MHRVWWVDWMAGGGLSTEYLCRDECHARAFTSGFWLGSMPAQVILPDIFGTEKHVALGRADGALHRRQSTSYSAIADPILRPAQAFSSSPAQKENSVFGP